MKKIIFLFIVFLLVSHHSFAFEVWQKLGNGIYFDTSSIKKENDATFGWFKSYSSNENYLPDINGKKAHYELVQVKAFCTSKEKVIYLNHFKYFDKNGNILLDEPNYHGVACSYDGVADGDIYIKALCSK